MQAEFLDTITAIERPLAEAIAARSGTDGQGRAPAKSVDEAVEAVATRRDLRVVVRARHSR
jgi:hypothetical protein